MRSKNSVAHCESGNGLEYAVWLWGMGHPNSPCIHGIFKSPPQTGRTARSQVSVPGTAPGKSQWLVLLISDGNRKANKALGCGRELSNSPGFKHPEVWAALGAWGWSVDSPLCRDEMGVDIVWMCVPAQISYGTVIPSV